jgi:hypothetical protein
MSSTGVPSNRSSPDTCRFLPSILTRRTRDSDTGFGRVGVESEDPPRGQLLEAEALPQEAPRLHPQRPDLFPPQLMKTSQHEYVRKALEAVQRVLELLVHLDLCISPALAGPDLVRRGARVHLPYRHKSDFVHAWNRGRLPVLLSARGPFERGRNQA